MSTFVLAACKPPRVAPAVPAGEWVSSLGSPARSAYADAEVGDSVAVSWRKGVDRGFAVPLQIHGPVLIATTTGRSVVVLNAQSGMQYWSRRFAGPIAGTALRRDDRIFVATGDREDKLHALDIRRGRGVWSKRVGTVRVEPLLLDSTIVAATESGEVLALRTRDGSESWRSHVGAAPAIAPVATGNRLFVATSRDTLYELDAGRGEILARLALPARPTSPALVHDGHLIMALGTREMAGISVAGPPRIDWRASLESPVVAAPLAVGEDVFVLDREATVWRIGPSGDATRLAALGGAASGSFTAVGGRLLVGRLDGFLFLLDGRTGEVVWQLDLQDSIITPVAAQDGVVFVPLLRGTVVRLQ